MKYCITAVSHQHNYPQKLIYIQFVIEDDFMYHVDSWDHIKEKNLKGFELSLNVARYYIKHKPSFHGIYNLGIKKI